MLVAHIKAGKERAFERRHPWVYPGAIAHVRGLVGPSTPGETIRMVDSTGAFLAWGAYTEASQLRIRVWSFKEDEVIDASFFQAKVAAACLRRAGLRTRTTAVRLIFGEADGLPGLVVDRYGDQLVVQCMSGGADFWRETIADALETVTGCDNIYERSDAAARKRDGLEPREGVLRGAEPAPTIAVTEDEIHYGVNVREGHKTGFYVDQRDNRRLVFELVRDLILQRTSKRVSEHSRSKTGSQTITGSQTLVGSEVTASPSISVLNCFCYTGGFSLAALKAGADEVISVDSSGEALLQGQKNWALNVISAAHSNPLSDSKALSGLPVVQTQEWLDQNVFDYLKQAQKELRLFDVIILDPPKFAPSAHHLDKASRAYKELNLKALQLLKPNGLLLTFSCSGAVSVDLFQKIVAGAIFDAGIDAQMLKRLAAGTDHPMSMTHPEGEYLKGLLLRRI
jgi:23S rRNA (cytosine1962-C5)-methyltransferase